MGSFLLDHRPRCRDGLGRRPAAEGGRLKLVESVVRDDLDSVVKAVISPDGKFLYAASWKLGKLLTFRPRPEDRQARHKQTISDPENLGG